MKTLFVPLELITPNSAQIAGQSIKATVCQSKMFSSDSMLSPNVNLKGYDALSLLGAILGDTGGNTSPDAIPDGRAIFDVTFSAFYINDLNEPEYIDICVQRQCLPKDAQITERDITIIDAVFYAKMDVVGDINCPLDDDVVNEALAEYKAEHLSAALGAVGWRVSITPKAPK